MNILLSGAGGFIGRHILKALEQQNHQVTACCRHPEKLLHTSATVTIRPLDYNEIKVSSDWLPHLQDIDVVINCVGIIAEGPGQSFQTLHERVPINLFRAAVKAGVKKIIQISALGADASAQSAYHLSKKAADDTLRKLDLDWYILQPSIVYGDGAQSMALFHALAALPIQVLIDGGRQKLQPIHVGDVADAVIQCLKPKATARLSLPLVGPESIAFGQLLQQLRQRLGKKPAPAISLPAKLVRRTAFIGHWLGEPAFNAESIEMLRRGNTADARPLSQFIGRSPNSLAQKLLSITASQAERWHAGLYFLRPLLRLSIAFLWLWSGIVSLFFYPREHSYQFLAATGISGSAAPPTLYGLALLDIAIGLATLAVYRIRRLIFLQLITVFLYTVIISAALPELWLHPFGPVLKNIPLLVSMLVYLQLEGEKP
ncbi:MAG: NAD(P)H-binding protein [Gammaproteobacteria bacterium]